MNRLNTAPKRIAHFSIFHILLSGHFSDFRPLQFHNGMLVHQHFYFLQIIGMLKSFFSSVVFLIHIFSVLCAFWHGLVGSLARVLLWSWGYRII